MHSDPINSMHLARLLKNKLLQECIDTPVSTNKNQLPHVDAEKLNQLENILTSKRSTGGPTFPGNEEFYKEFIATTNSHNFHRHLRDYLVAEILQLDESDFWPSEIKDTGDSSNMVHRVLKDVLDGELTLEELISWIENTDDQTETSNSIQQRYLTSQCEFIESVTKFLYEQTAWVLEANNLQDTATKSITTKYVTSDKPSIDSDRKRAALFPVKQDSQNEASLGVDTLNINDFDIQTSRLSFSGRVSFNAADSSLPTVSSPARQAKEWPAIGGRRSQQDNSEADSPASENKVRLSAGHRYSGTSDSISPVFASNRTPTQNKTWSSAGRRSNASDTSYQATGSCYTPPTASSTTPTHSKAWPSAGGREFNLSDTACQASVSCNSPLSPSVTGRKSGTGTKKKSSTPKCARTNPNFSLGDFIVEGKPKKKSKQKLNISGERLPAKDDSVHEEWPNVRTPSPVNSTSNTPEPVWVVKEDPQPATGTTKRIKPTNLTVHDASTSGRVMPQDKHNVFSFQKISEVELSAENTQQQREYLKVECLKLSARAEPSDSNLPDNIISCSRTTSHTKISVQVNIDFVTYKPQLEILSKIYSTFIDNHLIHNNLSALHYFISIVITRFEKLERSDQLRNATDNDYTRLFKTAHNCVFFATSVLNLQSHLLSVFDRPTIKLLHDNSRIKTFCPDLTCKLSKFIEQKIERKHEYPRTSVANAGFILDTDTRDNFISASSFHTFRKQRDLFCNLLDIWKKEHIDSDWKFAKSLGDKIRRLHYMHPDPINSMHLARLLKNKLLQECIDTPVSTNKNQLPHVDAEKLNRLENRLTSKRSTGGLRAEPTFPGNEEFYKEFIATTNSHIFHRHLRDCLIAEILQLDETDFWPSEIEDSETAVDPETRKKFLTCLKSVKLLSKFLAFLESLPYRTHSVVAPPRQIYHTQLTLRQHFMPAINVKERIKLAIKFGRLTITIPWVAEYIAMLDFVTLRLPYFSQLVETLYKIHYTDSKTLGFMGRIEGPLMVKLCLGWLFELRHFPIESYRQWLINQYLSNTRLEGVVDQPTFQYFVDQLDLVDENVLYTVCPYLYEIRSLLNTNPDSNTNRSGPAKYIRPITTRINDPDTEEKRKKRMETDMEELFFQNHPTSLRRIVDFVVERVASTCVKYVWSTMVPKFSEKAIDDFHTHLEHLNGYNVVRKRHEILNCCTRFSNMLAYTKVAEMRTEYEEEMQRQVSNRCTSSIGALLADDLFATVGSVAINIANKHTHQKISEWFTTHVTPVIFQREFDVIVAKIGFEMKPTSSRKPQLNRQGKKTFLDVCHETVRKNTIRVSYKIPSLGRSNIEHDTDVKSPTMLLIDTHKLLMKVADEPHLITYQEMFENISEARTVFAKRCDYSAKVIYEMCECYKRLAYLIVANVPYLLKTPILKDIMQFWNDFLAKKHCDIFFARIFSPLNAALFIKAPNPAASWDAAADLVLALIEEKFVTDEQIQEQAVAMFRFEWPDGAIMDFSKCLRKIVDERIRKTGRMNEYGYTMAWLASFTEDSDYF